MYTYNITETETETEKGQKTIDSPCFVSLIRPQYNQRALSSFNTWKHSSGMVPRQVSKISESAMVCFKWPNKPLT